MNRSTAIEPSKEISTLLLVVLATGAGLAVASLYYCQPLLGILGQSISASTKEVGYIPTFTQLGYALGMLLLTPLGDRYDRRNVISLKGLLLIGALSFTAMSQNITYLCIASFLIGLMATLAQDIVPAAAALSAPESRGKNIGKIMTGLLLGILLSRAVSGFMAEWFGWRGIFIVAALAMLLVIIILRRVLPKFTPTVTLKYSELILSVFGLLAKSAVLRKAALAQGLLGVSFSAFWSILAVMLYDKPFHMGSTTAGLFGLAGAFGALMAPVFGKFADRIGAEKVTHMGTLSVAVSFILMFLFSLLNVGIYIKLAILALTTIIFDMGVQATFIAHQSIIYKVDPTALSRLNAIIVVGAFTGMSIGGFIGSQLYVSWGWPAVTLLAMTAAILAFITRILPEKTTDKTLQPDRIN
ncbi:MFS transporter [uncultured Tolumonas sp.]|uniref:MFS transporter n=1 Tax=uncultured Tolumonas sp. TaxID=263765 RepID=UPI002A0A9908|nr:MFS transporter [uncultured Tolumonas sp.]